MMLKDTDKKEVEVVQNKKVTTGKDTDTHGCVTSAGYRWSVVHNSCIRVFEEGYRLNTIYELKGEDITKSAFIVFKESDNLAELYLPDGSDSILLKKEGELAPYKNEIWTLELNDGYALSKNNELMYAGAVIEESKVVGDYKHEP